MDNIIQIIELLSKNLYDNLKNIIIYEIILVVFILIICFIFLVINFILIQ